MKYSVVWVHTAERSLASIWIESADRNAVTSAARQIDLALETDPTDVGESRDSNHRVAFEPPLACTFSIHPSAQLVRVLRVWKMCAKED